MKLSLVLAVVLLAMVLLLCLDEGDAAYGKHVGRHSKHRKRFRSSRKFTHKRRKSKHRKRGKRSHGSSASTHQIENKIHRLESKMDRISKEHCPHGQDGDAGHCMLCKDTEDARQLSFEIPDLDTNGDSTGTGRGRLACCLKGDDVNGLGKCVSTTCDMISSATYSGDSNILYLRDVMLDFSSGPDDTDPYMLDCDLDGCCTALDSTFPNPLTDFNIACDMYLGIESGSGVQDGSGNDLCESDQYLIRVVAGIEADGGSSSGLDFDIYNSPVDDGHNDDDDA